MSGSKPRAESLPATPRQVETLRVVHALTVRAGYPPSIREVQAAVGHKSNTSIREADHVLDRS